MPQPTIAKKTSTINGRNQIWRRQTLAIQDAVLAESVGNLMSLHFHRCLRVIQKIDEQQLRLVDRSQQVFERVIDHVPMYRAGYMKRVVAP